MEGFFFLRDMKEKRFFFLKGLFYLLNMLFIIINILFLFYGSRVINR